MNQQPDPALVAGAPPDQHGVTLREAAQAPYPPAPRAGMFHYTALVVGALVALAALATAVLLLYPRSSPVAVVTEQPVAAQRPVPAVPTAVQPPPTTVYLQPQSTVIVSPLTVVQPYAPAPGSYSCGTAEGHVVYINNGNVPCGDALTVALQWINTGTTPGYGAGSAGTVNSWSCTNLGSASGFCTSKMGSHLTIED